MGFVVLVEPRAGESHATLGQGFAFQSIAKWLKYNKFVLKVILGILIANVFLWFLQNIGKYRFFHFLWILICFSYSFKGKNYFFMLFSY